MKKLKLSPKVILLALAAILFFVVVFTTIAMIGSHSIFDEIDKLNTVEGARKLAFAKANGTNNATLTNDQSDSDFNILQISDMHYVCSIFSVQEDKQAVKAVADLVYATKPDLIVLTGDQTYSMFFNGSINNYISVEAVGRTMEAFGIPWTVVFGNHDSEFFSMMKLSRQADYYASLPHCLFSTGQEDIEGVGNYAVELLNFDCSLNTALFMFDCNGYDGFFGVYNYIRDGQVDWYKQEIERLNTRDGSTVSSLVFVHIPLYEYHLAQQALDIGDPEATLLRGVQHESISSTKKSIGKMFAAIRDLKSTKAVFCGHDHVNNTAIRYQGVTLAFGMSIDYSAYAMNYHPTQYRGGQLIVVDKNKNVQIALVTQDNAFQPITFVTV